MVKCIILILIAIFKFTFCERYAIETKNCKILDFDPFDSDILPVMHEEEEEIICNNGLSPLVDSNLTSIYILRDSFRFYGIVEERFLNCRYTPFNRVVPDDYEMDPQYEFNQSVDFINSTRIDDEFILVECFYNSQHIYRDFFSFVPLKSGLKVNDDGSYNVLLIGFDGTSRLNYYRHMPRLRKVLEKLGAIQFFGYNKVGDNSSPNLMALFTGTAYEVPDMNTDKDLGKYPFVWKEFKKHGYATAFGEETGAMGSFNKLAHGFRAEQTTDYYWSYFNMLIEKQIACRPNVDFWDCLGAREVYKVFLEYITKFLTIMTEENVKFFASFFSTIMSHDSMAKPLLSDGYIAEFFDSPLMRKVLENTILIVHSDHGFRWSKFRQTLQGAVEDKTPLLTIYLPNSFKIKYKRFYENFLINTRRLISPFDLRQTLIDIIRLKHYKKNKIVKKKISLFDNIPENRSCDEAYIPLRYCSCYITRQNLSTTDNRVQTAANLILKNINNMIKVYTMCVTLKLNEILDGRILNVGKNSNILSVLIETTPGYGRFEAAVDLSSNKVIGDINRVNRYGGQSTCVWRKNFYKLRLYCYCLY